MRMLDRASEQLFFSFFGSSSSLSCYSERKTPAVSLQAKPLSLELGCRGGLLEMTLEAGGQWSMLELSRRGTEQTMGNRKGPIDKRGWKKRVGE